MGKTNTHSGFTIVELLIVIVVIGILAAITVVAYGGIQQRARNTSIINAVGEVRRAIQAYATSNDKYPYIGGSNVCVTSITGCVRDSGGVDSANVTFNNNMSTVGSLPKKVASSGAVAYGITYNYTVTRTFNGSPQPAILFYWLEGLSQNCGFSDILNSWETAVTSTTGYTASNSYSTGKTLCYVSIPGPAV